MEDKMDNSSPLRRSWDTGYWTANATPSDSFLHLNQMETTDYINIEECESLSKEDPPSLLLQIQTSSVSSTTLGVTPSFLATPASEEVILRDHCQSPNESDNEVAKWLSLRLFLLFYFPN